MKMVPPHIGILNITRLFFSSDPIEAVSISHNSAFLQLKIYTPLFLNGP